MLSAAGQMLNLDRPDYGGADLLQRRSDEIDDAERKRKMQAAADFSPAGASVFNVLGMGKPYAL